MRQIFICLLTLFTFAGTAAYAGSGHSHGPVTPISEAQALKKATDVVVKIVKKGKIDGTWAQVKPTEAKKKSYKNGPEWVVTFDNPKAEDNAQQTLYVFLSLSGRYLAANFSGS